MDENTTERINQLAKSLKDLHLVPSMEEAYARAKEIVLGGATQGHEKSMKELLDEAGVTLQDVQKAKTLLKEEEQSLTELKKELAALKAKQFEEHMEHAAHTQETEKLDKELNEREYDIGVLDENIDMAERVQQQKKPKQ